AMRFLSPLALFSMSSMIGCACGSGDLTGGAGGASSSAATLATTASSTASASCVQQGKLECSGACVDITNDPQHCGDCATDCGKGLCCESACVEDTASCAFAPTATEPHQGFQNGGDWITIKGAGFQQSMKVFLADGRAPAR